MDLAAASRRQAVVLGGRRYRLRPPTVEEALVLLGAESGAEAGGLVALAAWLPASLLLAVRPMSPRQRAHVVGRLLKAFTPDLREPSQMGAGGEEGEDGEPADGPPGEPAGEPDWPVLLLEYAMAVGADPYVVYQRTPWPFFLMMLRDLTCADARQQLRRVDLAVLPHAKEPGRVFDRLERRARQRSTGSGAHVGDPARSRMMTDPDYRAAQLRKLDRFFGRVAQEEPGSPEGSPQGGLSDGP